MPAGAGQARHWGHASVVCGNRTIPPVGRLTECVSTATTIQAGKRLFPDGGAGEAGDGCAGGRWGCKGALGLSDDQQAGCEGQSLPLRVNVGSEAKLSRADTRGPGASGRGTWPRQHGGRPRGSLPHDVDRRRHCPEGKGCSAVGNPGRTETHFSSRLELEIGQGPHSCHV